MKVRDKVRCIDVSMVFKDEDKLIEEMVKQILEERDEEIAKLLNIPIKRVPEFFTILEKNMKGDNDAV